MCYYRFDQLITSYGRSGGYDLVRGSEIGVKVHELTHLEEAFHFRALDGSYLSCEKSKNSSKF